MLLLAVQRPHLGHSGRPRAVGYNFGEDAFSDTMWLFVLQLLCYPSREPPILLPNHIYIMIPTLIQSTTKWSFQISSSHAIQQCTEGKSAFTLHSFQFQAPKNEIEKRKLPYMF